MSKFGLYSDKSSQTTIPFETHLEGLGEQRKTLLLSLRDFVKSLGNNVIEEVRPHRIVYAKSLTFRTFLDVQPKNDSITISVRKDRSEPPRIYIAKTEQELEDIKYQIAEAHKTIR